MALFFVLAKGPESYNFISTFFFFFLIDIISTFLLQATGNMTIGQSVLASHGLNFDGYFYWISVGALIGFMILFDLGFILALTYLKRKSILNNNQV